MPAFETAEYRDRVRRLSAEMEKDGIDTLVILTESHMDFLTGYAGYSDYVPQCAILRAGDTDAALMLRAMDLYCAYPTSYLGRERIHAYGEHYIGTPERSPWEAIGAKVLEIAGKGRIGVELGAPTFSYRGHQALSAALGGREMADGTALMQRVKIRKSPAELACMRQAGRIADKAFASALDKLAEGVRQCDVAAVIHHDLVAGTPQGGGGPHKPVTMPTGPGVAQAPHLKWTNAPYRKGDQTDFEIGATVHRYTCGLSRTTIIGQPSDRLRYVHDAVLEGFEAARAVLGPGARCSDVHRAFKAAFDRHGIEKASRIGYSIGLDWGDLCFSLQGDDDTVLEPGFTAHLIIGIWEPEDAYVFSETIEVGQDKGISLSATPRELFVR